MTTDNTDATDGKDPLVCGFWIKNLVAVRFWKAVQDKLARMAKQPFAAAKTQPIKTVQNTKDNCVKPL